MDNLAKALLEEKARLRAVIEDARKRTEVIDGMIRDLGITGKAAAGGNVHPMRRKARTVEVRREDVLAALGAAVQPLRARDLAKVLNLKRTHEKRVYSHLKRLQVEGIAERASTGTGGARQARFWMKSNRTAATAANL